MHKNAAKLLGLYILGVIGYAFFVSRFTIPVHLTVDEELYISMARSFHYQGHFSQGGTLLDYTCVLYSMLLSLAYYFAGPEDIMFFFRMIGTVVMLSSVFPVYLLAKRMLGPGGRDGKTIWIVTALTLFLPSMTNAAYCMQEVLVYPIFLWTAYFVYREIQEGRVLRISGDMALIAALAAVGYFSKTMFLFLPLLYCACMIWEACRQRCIAVWKKLALFSGIWAILYAIGKGGILWINGGIAGSNHYSAQFSRLFPIDWRTIAAILSCIVFYLVALCFYWGVLPVVLPIADRKAYSEQDRGFLRFLLLGILILVAEIVISVVITEEGKVLLPHKLLYRYFQMFELPLLLVYLKGRERFRLPGWIWPVYIAVFTYLGFYFAAMGDRQRIGIIDAPIFLLIDNITQRFLPHFNILACGAAAAAACFMWVWHRRHRVEGYIRWANIVGLAAVGAIFLINLYQLPYYNNQVAMGAAIQEDAVSIAEYISGNGLENVAVYYLDTQKAPYGRAVYAYLPQEVIPVAQTELGTLTGEYLLISDGEEGTGDRVELDLQVLHVSRCK